MEDDGRWSERGQGRSKRYSTSGVYRFAPAMLHSLSAALTGVYGTLSRRAVQHIHRPGKKIYRLWQARRASGRGATRAMECFVTNQRNMICGQETH